MLSLTPGSPPNLSRQVLGDTIIFRSVQMGSSAVYQCNASNQHGYLLANAFISVLGEIQKAILSLLIGHFKIPVNIWI